MAHILGCENVSLSYPSKMVLDSVSLGVDDGDRIGVVGRNGDGKSSLLSILAGLKTPDSGRVTVRSGTNVAMLSQSDALSDSSLVSAAVVGDMPEYEWASNPAVRDVIEGLLGDVEWDGRVGDLSGGQRRRVDLARVLVGNHDVVMLDEPTNHLDLQGIVWLANHLRNRWPRKSGALLVISHDRWFLDEVSTSMWEVHSGQVDRFDGGYSAYVLQRVEREAAAQVAEQKRQNTLRKELAWLSRGARARSTKPKFHVALARELIAGEPPARDSVELKRTAVARLGKRVVDLEDVTVRYGDRTVLSEVTWSIGPGDRFGILGENGAGKSTLLNVLRGVVAPTSGTVRIGKTVKFATLSQNLDELEQYAQDRVLDVLSKYKTRYVVEGREVSPTQLLERLGFKSAQISALVSDLSGGQRRRLQLMLTLLGEPNVLILDEPDNDLDIDMLTVLEDLLDSWPGTLLLITHDRHLMERVTDHQYALVDGQLRHVPRGVEQYLEIVGHHHGEKPEIVVTAATGEMPGPKVSRADEYRLKKEFASVERKLATLQTKRDDLAGELARADHSDYLALQNIMSAQEMLEVDIAALEDRWIEITDLLANI